MKPAGGQADYHVMIFKVLARQRTPLSPRSGIRQDRVSGRIHARHFGGFAAEQGASRLLAP